MIRPLVLLLALLLVPSVAGAVGNCAPFRSWNPGDDVTAADLNSSFTTAATTNSTPQCLDDYSTSVTQMRVTTDPYPAASESLATSLAGELERVRFVLKALTGWSQWYAHTEGTVLAPLALGSVTAPSLRFLGDTNTGIYSAGAENLSFTTAGVQRLFISTAGVEASLPVSGPNGVVSAPTFTFAGDYDTGVYRSAADTVDVAAGGVRAFSVKQNSASDVNFLQVLSRIAGSAPQIASTGPDTDISIALVPKGAGNIRGPDGSLVAPGYSFFNDAATGLFRSGASTLDVAAGGVRGLQVGTVANGVNYWRVASAVTGSAPQFIVAGTDTNIAAEVITKGSGQLRLAVSGNGTTVIQTNAVDRFAVDSVSVRVQDPNLPFVPAAVSGTPAQNGLFRENVVKGWVRYNGLTQTINDSFNVASVVRNAVGDYTITWDRDFANATYAVICVPVSATVQQNSVGTTSYAAGSVKVSAAINGASSDWDIACLAMGDQ